MKLKTVLMFLFFAAPAMLLAQTTELPVTPEEQLEVIAPAAVNIIQALILIASGILMTKVWPSLKARKPLVVQGIIGVLGIAAPLVASMLPESLAGLDVIGPFLVGLQQAGIEGGAISAATAVGAFHAVRDNVRKG